MSTVIPDIRYPGELRKRMDRQLRAGKKAAGWLESLPSEAREYAMAYVLADLLQTRTQLRWRKRIVDVQDALIQERPSASEVLGQKVIGDESYADMVLRDLKRQIGTRQPRRPAVDDWLDAQLRRKPEITAPELWSEAPDWITEQLGRDRFGKRVTSARKRRK